MKRLSLLYSRLFRLICFAVAMLSITGCGYREGKFFDYDIRYEINGEQMHHSSIETYKYTLFWHEKVGGYGLYFITYDSGGYKLCVQCNVFVFCVFSESPIIKLGKLYDSPNNEVYYYYPFNYMPVKIDLLSSSFVFDVVKDPEYGKLLKIEFDFVTPDTETLSLQYNEQLAGSDFARFSNGELLIKYNENRAYFK